MFFHIVYWVLTANHCMCSRTLRCLFACGVLDSEMDITMDTVMEIVRNRGEPQPTNSEWIHSVAIILSLYVHITITNIRLHLYIYIHSLNTHKLRPFSEDSKNIILMIQPVKFPLPVVVKMTVLFETKLSSVVKRISKTKTVGALIRIWWIKFDLNNNKNINNNERDFMRNVRNADHADSKQRTISYRHVPSSQWLCKSQNSEHVYQLYRTVVA